MCDVIREHSLDIDGGVLWLAGMKTCQYLEVKVPSIPRRWSRIVRQPH